MKKIISLFKSKVFRGIFLGSPIVIGLVVAGVFYARARVRVEVPNSVISAPVINIAPSVAGRVSEMDVKEGQSVEVGDVLAVVGSETLRAETDGLIIAASDLTGSSVNSQTQLISMIRPVNLRVQGTLDETKGLNRVKVGQPVSFSVDALPGKKFWGYVDEISPSAKSSSFTFSTSTERTTQKFLIYARFDSSTVDIKNGMSAKMTIYTQAK